MGATGSWRAFTLLMALAIAAMVFKKLTVCSWVRRHNPGAAVSFIGGILGAAACSVSPSPLVRHLWWAPAVLDSMGAPYLLIAIWIGIRRWLDDRSGSAEFS